MTNYRCKSYRVPEWTEEVSSNTFYTDIIWTRVLLVKVTLINPLQNFCYADCSAIINTSGWWQPKTTNFRNPFSIAEDLNDTQLTYLISHQQYLLMWLKSLISNYCVIENWSKKKKTYRIEISFYTEFEKWRKNLCLLEF